MAILVTGGAGYIGSHTCVELLNNNFEIVVIDNFSNSKPEVLDRIEEITAKELVFKEIDLLDKHSLDKLFVENDINSVIHFAGYKSVGESVSHPLKYYENNIVSTINLLEAMEKFNVLNLVFSSSATVYGKPRENPIKEDFGLSAHNPYGETKLFIEDILRSLYKSNPKWNISILRYFNPIGAHESGLIGEDPSGIPSNLMPYITQVAIGKRDRLNIFGNDYSTPDGTGIRDYIHVMDLAKGHLKALERLKMKKGLETFNLGTGRGYSVIELVDAFKSVSGIEIPYEFVNRRDGDIDMCYADPTLADTVLNWKSNKTIKDMCRDSWNWQNKNPQGYNLMIGDINEDITN